MASFRASRANVFSNARVKLCPGLEVLQVANAPIFRAPGWEPQDRSYDVPPKGKGKDPDRALTVSRARARAAVRDIARCNPLPRPLYAGGCSNRESYKRSYRSATVYAKAAAYLQYAGLEIRLLHLHTQEFFTGLTITAGILINALGRYCKAQKHLRKKQYYERISRIEHEHWNHVLDAYQNRNEAKQN